MAITLGSKGRSSIHIRWRMTDSLRACATCASQKPDLRPIAAPHSFRARGKDVRDNIALAASNRSLRVKRSPHFEIRSLMSTRGHPEIGADVPRASETMRVLDRRDEADRRDRTHAGRRHHQLADIVLTSDASKLLCDRAAFLDRTQQRQQSLEGTVRISVCRRP